MKFILSTANCVRNPKNILYPNVMEIGTPKEFCAAIAQDHVCGTFEGNRRSKEHFKESVIDMFDYDGSGDSWITIEEMHEKLADYNHILVPSAHNMISKGSQPAAPHWHCYLLHAPFHSAEEVAAFKQNVFELFPFLDSNALDAARLVYGCSVDPKAVLWNDTDLTIDFLFQKQITPEGCRNTTMHRFAVRVLKHYGDTEIAQTLFASEAQKCDPPLPESELSTIWNSALRFYQTKIQTSPEYVSPEDYEKQTLQPKDYTDVGQARVLAQEYGDELLYTTATDLLRYNGVFWEESKPKAVSAAIEFTDLQLADAKEQLKRAKEALELMGITENDLASGKRELEHRVADRGAVEAFEKYQNAVEYLKFALKRRDMKYILSALQTLKPMVHVDISELDSDPYLLNTPSYTIDITKGMAGIREHAQADKITKVTAVDPSDKGKELWLDALNKFFSGDRELIDYVQVVSGLAVIGEVLIEALYIYYGPGGNGKSTFGNAILKTIGSYGGTISADALTVNCKRNVKPELAEAKGKRLLIASEMEEGQRLSTSIAKQLCSTDEIAAEKKYKDPFHFTPSHNLVLYTNHLPKVGAMDDGIWSRLMIIPFNAKLRGEKDMKNYGNYLFENAGEYILKWLIEGAEKLIAAGGHYPVPQCVEDAIRKYKSENDWLTHFLTDCCRLSPELTSKSGQLYDTYRAYCARVGEFTRSTSEFYHALEQRGVSRKRNKNGVTVYGVALIPEDFT